MKKVILKFLRTGILAGVVLVTPPLGFASTDLAETVENTGLSGSFLASRVAIGDKDDDAAVQFLERALALDPENASIKQDLFISLVTNGRVDEAAKLAGETEKLATSSNLARIVVAADAIRKRSWNKVADSLKEVDGVDLDRIIREILIAWSQQGEGKLDDALARLNELEGPEWIKAMKDYHSGLMAAASGKNDIAAEKFQAVIDNRAVIAILTETYIRAIEAHVRNRSMADDREAARKSLDYGLSLLPNHSPFEVLDTALKNETVLTPLITSPQQGSAELLYNVATAIRRDGGNDIAKSYLQLANFLGPESDVVLVGLAELYLQQRNFKKSNSYYDLIPETSAFYHISRLERANNLARLDQKIEAIDALHKLLDEKPFDLAGYMTLGGIYAQEKRFREAAEVYERAVARFTTLKPYHWNLFFRRGIAYERLKEWEKAEPSFKKALELSKNQPEVLNYLGYSWIDQGINLDEGMEMIRKAVELRPRSGFIVDSLGWAHYRLGKYEEAVKELERAVALMPHDPTINDHLGDAYWQVGRKLEATFQWKIALASKTPPDNPTKIQAKLDKGLIDEPDDAAKAN